MKNLFTFMMLLVAISFLVIGCKKKDSETETPAAQQDLVMALFSDPHLQDPSLGISGPAFDQYLLYDRKMIAQSKPILESMVATLKSSNASVILVPGDLTKDGEKSNHEIMAQLLDQLEKAGKRVYVIPGNHDILNPHAVAYNGSETTPVASVTADEFATIYGAFGYNEALYRDPASLTYIVSLNAKTWLLAMDGCRYAENTTSPVTSGKFSEATYQWIKTKLADAQAQGIEVFGMMHHGLIEHYGGQSLMFADYLLENWPVVSQELADLGMKVVFTGHYHAQDIVQLETDPGNFLFDIETGSLVTWPVPYRIVTYKTNQQLVVETRHITSLEGYEDFEAFSRNYLQQGMDTLVKIQIMMPPYSLPYEQAAMVSPLVVAGFVAHYHGDEVMDPQTQAGIDMLTALGGTAAMVSLSVQAMFADPAPGDQNITIDLATGTVLAR